MSRSTEMGSKENAAAKAAINVLMSMSSAIAFHNQAAVLFIDGNPSIAIDMLLDGNR